VTMVVAPVMMARHRCRRNGRHGGDGRRRRSDGRGRRSGAGGERESRKQSGGAERPASRDKTHVSPPRVESDTLYQLDTQSRAVQDRTIIASSRLFSMGNLTLNSPMAIILIFGAAVLPDGNPSATLRHRVEAALQCAKNHPRPRFIPTGAAGRHGPSEAAVMAGLLVKAGVPSNNILIEKTGYDTLSSARAIQKMLRGLPSNGSVWVATSAYHLPRCLLLLCILGISAHLCTPHSAPAATAWHKRWYWRIREIPAIPYDAILAIWARLTGH